MMTVELEFVAGSIVKKEEEKGEKGFVKGVVTYTVMDDLSVMPMSTISSVTLLNQFGIKDLSTLQEETVSLGLPERSPSRPYSADLLVSRTEAISLLRLNASLPADHLALTIDVSDLNNDLFGALVPCYFQTSIEILTHSSSSICQFECFSSRVLYESTIPQSLEYPEALSYRLNCTR
ncbi:hypothetical protein FCM35_KLT15621 [Carex littledalei]|uniref:Uncharacterized protein n=1 Tax=Carex littledalei TaxID=544730 RepID=A0A833R7Y7_9POAL|nr:hypothetical protein FCM35_KLT15621 [Carex littledalei]